MKSGATVVTSVCKSIPMIVLQTSTMSSSSIMRYIIEQEEYDPPTCLPLLI